MKQLALGMAVLALCAGVAAAAEKKASYTGTLEQIRAARQKIAANERDIYPLLEIIQGAAYPEAIREASARDDDAALLELYQAKHGEQWPRTVKGTPLLSYAAMNGDAPVVKRLLERGADVAARNAEGWTALHYAAEGGSAECVRLLLRKKAPVNAGTSRFNETPLMLACGLYGGGRFGTESARLLIRGGANVNARTKDGETSLMFASFAGRLDTVRVLLDARADAKAVDAKGLSALGRVTEFEKRVDGSIRLTQDSTSVPNYTLTVFDDLVRHGKVRPGRYRSEEIERKVEADALSDFLSIAKILREHGARE